MKAFLPEDVALPIPLHVVSHTPGRTRLRLARKYRELEVMSQIAGALKSFMPEIEQVRTNPQMGSLTIYYDRENNNLEDTFIDLQELGIITNETPTSKTPVAATVTSVMSRLNQRVNQFTEGSTDLRFLVPLLLVGFALRQLVVKGDPRFKVVPWYALIWYAFDTFMKLNPSPEAQSAATSNPKKPQFQKALPDRQSHKSKNET
jgi:hypothetical protein